MGGFPLGQRCKRAVSILEQDRALSLTPQGLCRSNLRLHVLTQVLTVIKPYGEVVQRACIRGGGGKGIRENQGG